MNSNNRDGERIASLETKMEGLEKQIIEVSTKLDTLINMIQIQQQNQVILDSRVKNLEHSSSLWKWLAPTLTAILTAVGTYLVLFYFQHK